MPNPIVYFEIAIDDSNKLKTVGRLYIELFEDKTLKYADFFRKLCLADCDKKTKIFKENHLKNAYIDVFDDYMTFKHISLDHTELSLEFPK